MRKLTEEEKDNLEGEIGSFEAGEILKKMKNNKSPGSDGFTSEFLKFFWKDLKVFVIGSLNYGYSLKFICYTKTRYNHMFTKGRQIKTFSKKLAANLIVEYSI